MKRLFELRDERIKQLKAEQEAADKAAREAESANIRNRILDKNY